MYRFQDYLIVKEKTETGEDMFILYADADRNGSATAVAYSKWPIYQKINETPQRTIRDGYNGHITFISKNDKKQHFHCNVNEDRSY